MRIISENRDDYKEIRISVNGIGIAEEYSDKIFEFFKRLHTKENYVGSGIELGICKYIVSKYKGTINVESTLGSGSTFIIKLPTSV